MIFNAATENGKSSESKIIVEKNAMDAEQKFKILYPSLVDGYKEFEAFISKVIFVQLMAIGWFVAKDNPFPQLANQTLMWTSLVVISITTLAIAWISIFQYQRSKKRFGLLKSLAYADESIFSHYHINIPTIIPVIFIHTGLFVIVLVLIYLKYKLV